MTYRVDIPNKKVWQVFRVRLSRQAALDLMDSLPCARTVRSDELLVAGHFSQHRWVMTDK